MDNVNASSHDHPLAGALGGARCSKPHPEVVPKKAQRRRFSASYKLKVLEEADAQPEQVGAILRREGLYSSHLQLEIEKLQRQVAALQGELYKSRAIIDAQKKLAEILGVDLPKITGHGKDDNK